MMSRKVEERPLADLTCLPQPREGSGRSEAEIAGLAQSIQEVGGILQPLLARREDDKLILLDGHRRLEAAKRAGLKTVPVIIEETALSTAEVLHRQLVIDAQRVELNPVERAAAIERLMKDAGWPAAQVAVKLGLSPGQVSKLLSLLVLPQALQDKVRSGTLAMRAAYEIAKVADPVQRERMAAAALGGLKDDLTGTMKAQPRADKRKARSARRSRVTLPLGGGRSIAIAAPDLSLEGLVTWLSGAVERLRALNAQGVALPEAVKAFSSKSA